MKQQVPKTREECFDILDNMLSPEDKGKIVEMEDTIELHFTLGLWIRNNWIYKQTEEETKALLKEFDDNEDDDVSLCFIHPDDYSSIILDAYQKYLKDK